MIEIKKEDLLKSTPDYEQYSENIASLSFDELKKIGYSSCTGCCKNGVEKNNCKGCKQQKCCKK